MIWGIFIHAMFISITIFIMNANTCSDIIGMEIFYFKVIRRLRIIVMLAFYAFYYTISSVPK